MVNFLKDMGTQLLSLVVKYILATVLVVMLISTIGGVEHLTKDMLTQIHYVALLAAFLSQGLASKEEEKVAEQEKGE